MASRPQSRPGPPSSTRIPRTVDGEHFRCNATEKSDQYHSLSHRKPYKSATLVGTFEKPWLANGHTVHRRREHMDRVLFWASIGLSLIGWGVLVYLAYKNVPRHDYCLIMDDDFQTLNSEYWSHEVQTGGFGTGAFDWTTTDPANTFVDSNGLHIVPTLTLNTTNFTADQMFNGTTLNLTANACTAPITDPGTDMDKACTATSNKTSGAIINPVRSARISTRGKKSITYGRVEIVAKLARGDWQWSALWMMPENSTYGPWPVSGEIDIAEARGNDRLKSTTGINHMTSTLHWGTSVKDDRAGLTTGKGKLQRDDYARQYHTYGLEWSEDYLFTWVDNRNNRILSLNFNSQTGNMWKRGFFVGSADTYDAWSQTGRYNTPFDQAFYLIANVAVGSTNGYFADGVDGKPWVGVAPTAMRDFWYANATWAPTWSDQGMTIKSVKMWQEGKCKT